MKASKLTKPVGKTATAKSTAKPSKIAKTSGLAFTNKFNGPSHGHSHGGDDHGHNHDHDHDDHDDHDHEEEEMGGDCGDGGGCCDPQAPLVTAGEAVDTSYVVEYTPIVPKSIQILVSIACLAYYIYENYWTEAVVISNESGVKNAVEWYMYVFENISAIGGTLFAGLMLYSLVNQIVYKKGGEIV